MSLGEYFAGAAAIAGLGSSLIGLWNQRKITRARASADEAKTTVQDIEVKVDGRLSEMIELLRAGEQRAGQLASSLQAAGLPVPPPLPPLPPPGAAPGPVGTFTCQASATANADTYTVAAGSYMTLEPVT